MNRGSEQVYEQRVEMILVPRLKRYHLCNRVSTSHYRNHLTVVNNLAVQQGPWLPPLHSPCHAYNRTAAGAILRHRLDQDLLPVAAFGTLYVPPCCDSYEPRHLYLPRQSKVPFQRTDVFPRCPGPRNTLVAMGLTVGQEQGVGGAGSCQRRGSVHSIGPTTV